MKIYESERKDKRLKAEFDNGKTVHFGYKYGNTFIDHQDEIKRKNYIKRHRVRENWKDPYKAGTLSRYLLWEKRDLHEAIRFFKRKFGV